MRLAVVAASRWYGKRQAAVSLLARLAVESTHTCVVIDGDCIDREARAPVASPSLALSEIAFSDWLKPGAVEDSVIDAHRIRRAPASLPIERGVLIDAAGHRQDLIVAALRECRAAWYPLDEWHPAFAVVCDDIALLPLADALASTFYCQPANLSAAEVRRLVADHQARAFVFRWFGYSTGRFTSRVAVALRRSRQWLEERLRRL